jgi:hypothetical protein
MRLWSLHPRHLDAVGLVALWREGLLAQAVLRGRTRGYRAHPQLVRFRECGSPVAAIATYLAEVHREAVRRGYRFDGSRLARPRKRTTLQVSEGQLRYEWEHLKKKLRKRNAPAYRALLRDACSPHPLFVVVPGLVSPWERSAGTPSA